MYDSIAGARAREDMTGLLRAWSGGDAGAADEVLSTVYSRIRHLAARQLLDQSHAPLQPTELANELVINLLDANVDWRSRVHFFKTAAVAMRNILCDLGRRQASIKGGGGQVRITLRAAEKMPAETRDDAEALHEVLMRLRAIDPRKADVIELHHLVGLETAEVAKVLDISIATVNRDLRFARTWLKRELDA